MSHTADIADTADTADTDAIGGTNGTVNDGVNGSLSVCRKRAHGGSSTRGSILGTDPAKAVTQLGVFGDPTGGF